MKEKRNLSKRIFSILLLLVIILSAELSYIPAKAAIIDVDPDNEIFDEANSLLIKKYPSITGFSYSTNIDSSRLEPYYKDAGVPIDTNSAAGAAYFSSKFNADGSMYSKNHNYYSWISGYESRGFIVKDIKRTDYISITHENAGTVDGEPVDINITYTNFSYDDNDWGVTSGHVQSGYSYLDLSANPYNGYIYCNIDHLTVKLTVKQSITKEAVDLTGAYLSFNSLNGPTAVEPNFHEFVNYETGNITSTTDAYIRKDANVKYESMASYDTSYNGYAINPQNNDFTDLLGADTFTKNSVSFKMTGTEQEFTVGCANGAVAWNAFSSALLVTVKGIAPTKEVDKSFAQTGEMLTYSITQKVHTLGQDLLTKYSSFVFTDPLPNEVEYVGVKFIDENGTDYTNYGTADYVESIHMVEFTLSSDFLKNIMMYEAESYTLQIITKVKNTITETAAIYNKGEVSIDSTNQDTNTVETVVSPFALNENSNIVKSIKTSSGSVNEYTLSNYNEDITFAGAFHTLNTKSLSSVVLSDTLNENLTYKSMKVYNSAGDDITSYGTMSINGKIISFNFSTSYLSAIAGDTITWEMITNYNGKTSFSDMKNKVITNTMSLVVNGAAINSNEVLINSPTLKVEKSVSAKEIQVGDTVTYTIMVANTEPGTTAKNIVVTDTSLKVGFTYVSADASGVAATVELSENGFIAKAASLAYGETLIITYKVKADSAANGSTTTNTVCVTADNTDEVKDTADLLVNTADLVINKVVSKKEWQVGDIIDYTIEVRNTASGSIAKNVVVSDISLPEGLKVDGEITVSDNSVTVKKEGTGFKAVCSELAYNKTITITFTCTASAAVNGAIVVNTATVTADNANPKEDTAEVYINSAALSIEKTSSQNEWKVGDKVDYTVTVKTTEKGTTARNVVVSDISLPEGLAVTGEVMVKGVEAEVTRTTTGFIIKAGELAYGTTMVITYECEAKEAVNGSEVVNTATAAADNADHIEDDEKVYINSPEVTVEKLSSEIEWKVNDMVDYTIIVKNTEKGTTAKNVVISDISLPEGLAVTGAVTVNGVTATVTQEGTGFKVACAELSAEDTLNITFACKAKESVNGTNVTNQVTVTTDNGEDAEDEEKVYINSPKLTVEKVSSENELKVGDTFDYTITVKNNEKGTVARNVVVTDNSLPDYLEISGDDIIVLGSEFLDYAIVRNSNGFVVNIAALEGEEEVVITVPCIVNEGAAGKEVVNIVTVTSDNADDAEDEETIWVNNPDLNIIKTADKIEKVYQVGDKVTYRLTIKNNAVGTIARNVTVNDTIETKGVELQNDTIMLKDDKGDVIAPKNLTVEGNNFTLETGVDLNTVEGKETILTVEYQVKIVDSSLGGKEVYNLAVVNSDEDLPHEDDETITIPEESEKMNALKTGDKSRVWLFAVEILLAVLIIGRIIYKKRKRR